LGRKLDHARKSHVLTEGPRYPVPLPGSDYGKKRGVQRVITPKCEKGKGQLKDLA